MRVFLSARVFNSAIESMRMSVATIVTTSRQENSNEYDRDDQNRDPEEARASTLQMS
jgi:hypothetical protein